MKSLFTKKQLAQYRARLEALIGELDALDSMTRESRRPVELDQTTQGRLSRMDALQVQAMQEATADRRRSEKARARAALERMDAGDFGYCVSCGEDIPAKRLDHDPSTPTCVDCA
tara:strand:+ start:571 stop:915 length:345 start_codon:yes stop_codon:yes gene_type:complete